MVTSVLLFGLLAGALLTGPSDPEYIGRLTELLPEKTVLESLRPALPATFILTNSGNLAIVRYVVRFDVTGEREPHFVFSNLQGKTRSVKAGSYPIDSLVA